MDLVSGLYWNINTVSSDHLRLLDGLISMPTSTGKQRRLIRYVSRQEGALLSLPPHHSITKHREEIEFDVIDVGRSVEPEFAPRPT